MNTPLLFRFSTDVGNDTYGIVTILQNQFEDASDEDKDGDVGDATSAVTQPPKNKTRSSKNSNRSGKNSSNRAAASLFFSDSTAPRHRSVRGRVTVDNMFSS